MTKVKKNGMHYYRRFLRVANISGGRSVKGSLLRHKGSLQCQRVCTMTGYSRDMCSAPLMGSLCVV